MSAFHRVDDITKLSAATFFALAYRLDSYQGAVRAAAEREAGEGPVIDAEFFEEQQRAREELYPHPPPETTGPEVAALTPEQLTAMFPAVPKIGQEVPMFEIAEVTDA